MRGRRPRPTSFCHTSAPAACVVQCGITLIAVPQRVSSMLPKPRADLKPNTADFERLPLVKPTGFREYDARWLFPQEINLMGLNAIGLGLATLAGRRGVPKRFVVGHDYRSYSAAVKQALIIGPARRRRGGARHRPGAVADGLLRPVRARRAKAWPWSPPATTTTAGPASRWASQRPLTFGPDEMTALKEIVLGGRSRDARRAAATCSCPTWPSATSRR